MMVQEEEAVSLEAVVEEVVLEEVTEEVTEGMVAVEEEEHEAVVEEVAAVAEAWGVDQKWQWSHISTDYLTVV